MTNQISGQHIAGADDSFAIVASRFNELVTKRLVEGAVDCLVRHGVDESAVTVVWVPGSFEIPLAASELVASEKYSAVICLGAVIQGQTTHHEYINSQVAAGIMNLSLQHHRPVTFGVITCESMEQALDRAGGKVGNKGEEAALAAIETLNVLRAIKAS